jgi:hypothetical protein
MNLPTFSAEAQPRILKQSATSIRKEKRNVPETIPITPETVTAMALQFLGMPLIEADAAATAGMLNALAADMQVFRKLPLGNEEPATTYAAVEGQP